jgi:hypothetical protein
LTGYQEPSPVRRQDTHLLDELRAAVTGRTLQTVSYVETPYDPLWHHNNAADDVHNVDFGVSLGLGEVALNATWLMQSMEESLAVAVGAFDPAFFAIGPQVIDVNAVEPWPSLIGRTVTNLSWAWHQPCETCPDLVWAVRVGLDPPASVVIALGEGEAGALRYQPDSVLVIFDEGIARSYSIPAGESPAWGASDRGQEPA